jgi:hypothetical protein
MPARYLVGVCENGNELLWGNLGENSHRKEHNSKNLAKSFHTKTEFCTLYSQVTHGLLTGGQRLSPFIHTFPQFSSAYPQ